MLLSSHGGRRRRRHRRCQNASYVCFPNLVSRVHFKLTVKTRCRHAQIVKEELFSVTVEGNGVIDPPPPANRQCRKLCKTAKCAEIEKQTSENKRRSVLRLDYDILCRMM